MEEGRKKERKKENKVKKEMNISQTESFCWFGCFGGEVLPFQCVLQNYLEEAFQLPMKSVVCQLRTTSNRSLSFAVASTFARLLSESLYRMPMQRKAKY